MSKPVEVKALVQGGKATAGPPLGSALGPLKVNVKAIVDKINEKTQNYSGMTVPIVVKVDPNTKTFDIEVSTPQTSVLLKKEANVEKGSSKAGSESVGNISIDAVVKVAKIKHEKILSISTRNAVKEVLGTALSCGLTVEGKNPTEIQKEVDNGTYDSLLK